MAHQTFTAPDGTIMAIVPLDELEQLREAAEDAGLARIAAAARRRLDAGDDEYIPWEMAKRLASGENAVRIWREHRGLKPSDLADRAGVSQAYLSQIETGVREGSIATLGRVADALDVQIDDLVLRTASEAETSPGVSESGKAPYESAPHRPAEGERFDERVRNSGKRHRDACLAFDHEARRIGGVRRRETPNGEGMIYKHGTRRLARLDPKPNASPGLYIGAAEPRVLAAFAPDLERGLLRPRPKRSGASGTWLFLEGWDRGLAMRMRSFLRTLVDERS